MQIGSNARSWFLVSRSLGFGSSTALASTLLLAGSAAFAQTNTTGLTGVVTDATGAVVQGVTVSIKNPATGTTETTSTKSKGEYTFSQVQPGTYEVHVTAPGFSEEVESVELLVSTPQKVDFKLTAGTSEVVEVSTAGLAAINSVDATLGKAFDSRQIQTLPYLANNITYLLSLQPGVLGLDSGAKTGGLNLDTRTGIVNGARQDQTNVTLDGVDNNDQTNGYAFNGALRATRESVEEFRVTTTNANADAGRSSGGQVSLVTRSGTNTVHGTAYEFYRGGIGLQNDWWTKQAQEAAPVPKNVPLKVLQNTYGASLGLPIKKDKLFFFGAYEGFQQASSQQVAETVPSIVGGGGLVTGNVTYGACAPGAASCTAPASYKTLTPTEIASLYNPSVDPACVATPASCHAPSSDAAALAYLRTFPIANSSSGGDGYNTGTYSFSSALPLHQITNIARLDYNLNARQVLFVRGNLQSDNQATALQFPGLPAASNIFGNNKGFSAGHTWNINSSMINNLRYGLVRQGTATRGTGSQPYTSFTAFSSITATTTSSIYLVTTNNFADDFTYTKGRHTIQAGVNDRLLSNSRYFDAPLQSISYISANLLATAAIAGKGTSLDPGAFTGSTACPDCAVVATPFRTFYNSAILANTGLIEEAQSGTEYKVQGGALVPQGAGVVPTHVYRNLEQEYYVQDQWKVTSRLTLTGGVRYVYLGTPYETYGQEIAPTISLTKFLKNRITAMNAGNTYGTPISFQAAGSANGAANFWSPQKANFAPRLAFAYSTADNKTAIHGGYAIAFDHVGEGIIDNYESTSSSLLSLSKTNLTTYTDVNTNPAFTGYHTVPAPAGSTASLPLPYTPANNPFTFDRSINDVIKTPYAETFNLSVQQEFARGLTFTLSGVGRLGRHALQNLDVAQPLNLLDPTSGQTYFQAAKAMDIAYDAGVSVANMPNTGYFANIFPNASYQGYRGAQAYYAYLSAGDRGNETDPLYNFDSTASAAPGGNTSHRFFFPQTSSIYAQSTIGNSSYNALQASLRHSLKYGLVYDFNYTWSKSIDEGSSPERASANTLQNTFNPKGNRAVSDYDSRHNITADFTAPLPFGKGRPMLNNLNGLVDRLIGGWQINGVVHYSSPFPFSAVASGNYGTNFDTSSYFVQTGPIPTGGHHYVVSSHTESALKGITPTQAYQNLRFAYAGEVGQRNQFREDSYFSLDNGFSKVFPTFREQSFKITAEVFNVTGSPRFGANAGTMGTTSGITTNGASTTFGNYLNGSQYLLTQPRQMQFSGKYTF